MIRKNSKFDGELIVFNIYEMSINYIKGIIFISFFLFYSCQQEKKSSPLETSNGLFAENNPVSGWYNFPLKIKIDSGNIYTEISTKNNYSNRLKYINHNQVLVINENLLGSETLGIDSIAMGTITESPSVQKWSPPNTKNIKVGKPLLFEEYDKKKWDYRIFFDASKKLNDNLMCISLIVDPNDLFNYDSGIYVQGSRGDVDNPKKGNYSMRGKAWEKEATVHFFEPNGDLRFKSTTSLKLHGNLSRAQPQKSFKLAFKGNPIYSNLFTKNQYIHRLILRTPFTSYAQGQSIIMDSFLGELAKSIGLDAMGSIPCNVYLNGEYWGIYHLREKIDQHYLKEKYTISKKSIDIVEYDRESEGYFKTVYGTKNEWVSLMNYINKNDLSKKTHFDYFSQKVNINNLIDYLLMETFFANKDWPGNNFKLWKSSDLDNKWKFVIYDMDACFRKDNMFNYILAENQEKGNNIFSSTLIFRKLFKNSSFKEKFLLRYQSLIEKDFNPKTLKKRLSALEKEISPSIQHQVDRWHLPKSYESWKNMIAKMKKYIETRTVNYETHLNKAL